MKLTAVGPSLTQKDINAFEQQHGVSLPQAYRTFLLSTNGGRPQPAYYDVPGWRFKTTKVSAFNGILPGAYNDLTDNIKMLKGRVPEGFIPIGSDPGGNEALLCTSGDTRGKVYFWDHENEPPGDAERLEDYPNIHVVAENFDSFLSSLKDCT